MKVYRINKLTYTIDSPMLFLFIGVTLDIISTFLFVALNAGREMHPVLGKLISISIWFIPFYLFITNAFFVPFLPRVLRMTLGYTIGLSSILFAVNNFSLVLFRNAFLVDFIGYVPIIVIFFIAGFILFFYFIKLENHDKQDITNIFFKLFIYITFIGLINLIFLSITWLPFRQALVFMMYVLTVPWCFL